MEAGQERQTAVEQTGHDSMQLEWTVGSQDVTTTARQPDKNRIWSWQ